jgi:hypothetical protein
MTKRRPTQESQLLMVDLQVSRLLGFFLFSLFTRSSSPLLGFVLTISNPLLFFSANSVDVLPACKHPWKCCSLSE